MAEKKTFDVGRAKADGVPDAVIYDYIRKNNLMAVNVTGVGNVPSEPVEARGLAAAATAPLPAGKTASAVARAAVPAAAGALASMVPLPQAAPFKPLLRSLASGLGGAAAGPVAGVNPLESGAQQALAQFGGEGLSGMLRGGGRWLQHSAINPPPELAEHFPGVWLTAEREGLGVGNPQPHSMGPEQSGLGEKMLGGKAPLTGADGAKWVRQKRVDPQVEAALAKVNTPQQRRLPNGQMVSAAPRLSPAEVARKVRARLLPKATRRPTDADVQMDDLVDMENRFLANHQSPMSVVEAHEVKRGGQEAAAELLDRGGRALASDARALAKSSFEEKYNREVQSVINEWLGENVPGYRALEKRAQDLIGLEKALRYRQAQPHGFGNPRLGGGGGFYLNPMDLMAPQSRSSLARMLYGPLATAATQAPRVGLGAYQAVRDATGGQP